MNKALVKLMDRDEVLGLAEAFRIEDFEALAVNDYDYLCELVARAAREE